jgi:hypothetical protein
MDDVLHERGRHDWEFGEQRHDPAYWSAILGKQFGQLNEKVVDHKWATNKRAEAQRIRHEAKQVAAVALAIMEAVELEELLDEVTTAMPINRRNLSRALGTDDESIHSEER